jgi:hypothetical protein
MSIMGGLGSHGDGMQDMLRMRETLEEPRLKTTFETVFNSIDSPFFSTNTTPMDLSALHPDPVRIFRLWDMFVANVNPLVKVIHTPTLQGLIIEAASNTQRIDPNLEALMFGIYSMAIVSLDPDNCEQVFGASKLTLTRSYQLSCWQALLNAKFLRTTNRDCLTAFYLYLVSLLFTALLFSFTLLSPTLCCLPHTIIHHTLLLSITHYCLPCLVGSRTLFSPAHYYPPYLVASHALLSPTYFISRMSLLSDAIISFSQLSVSSSKPPAIPNASTQTWRR